MMINQPRSQRKVLMTIIITAHFPPTDADLNGCADTPVGPIDPSNVYASGSKVDIKWTVSKTHPSNPGVRIAIQFPGESKFTVLKEKIPVDDGKATVQLPAGKTADKAVLHWLWGVESEKGFYMSCADITVKPGNAAVGSTIEPQKPDNGATVSAPTDGKGGVSVSASTEGKGNVGVSTSNNGAVTVSSTSNIGQTVTEQKTNGGSEQTKNNGPGSNNGAASAEVANKAVTTEQKPADSPAERTEIASKSAALATPNEEVDIPDCEEIITSSPGEVTLPIVKTSTGARVKTVIKTVIVYKCAA